MSEKGKESYFQMDNAPTPAQGQPFQEAKTGFASSKNVISSQNHVITESILCINFFSVYLLHKSK